MKNILLIISLIFSLNLLAQTKDTTRHILANKDTLLTIKSTINKVASITYPESSTIQVIKPFRESDTITPPPPPPPPPTTPVKYEGFGADVTGGSAYSTVYHVTNTNASGSGSLANGIGSNKTIVFDISGEIRGRISISGISNLTIDAYTSKQDITINGQGSGDVFSISNSKNILVRGIRAINGGNDGFNVLGSSANVVLDHCSSYGHGDGNIDLVATSSTGKNFTVQWCFIGNNNGSGEMLGTTQLASVHHNLFAGTGSGEGSERMPYFHSNYSPAGSGSSPNFDFRNNLLYNWGRYASGNGYKAVGNYVNNYYASNKSGQINLCADDASCGTAYVSGNQGPNGAVNSSGGTRASGEYLPAAKYRITTTDAKTAARAVLQEVGPWKKNSYEQGVINSINL